VLVTAEEVAQAVKYELDLNEAGFGEMQALSVLFDALAGFRHLDPKDIDAALEEPVTHISRQWDTLIASCIRYQLRKDHISTNQEIPSWLIKEPLEQMWWPVAKTPRKATNSFNTTPPELRRVGIFIAERSFK